MNKSYPTECIKAISDFLFIGKEKDDLEYSDLVIVLGNDYIDGTIKEIKGLFDIDVINDKTTIILSGATGAIDADKDLECNRLYNCAVDKFNLPDKMFIKESRATNAYENFAYSKTIIEDIGGFEAFNRILCIGKAFLLRRASMYSSKLEYPNNKMQYYGTVDIQGRNIGKTTWWMQPDSIERVMAEIKRIGEYALKGDLSIW